jgi:hypothetical protein
MEGGQCVEAEPPAPPVCKNPEAPPAGCASGGGPSQTAVESLVKSQLKKAESCTSKVVAAALKCADAAISIAIVETGASAARAGISSGECALSTVDAYRCVTK